MAEVFETASAAIGLLDQVIRLINRVRQATAQAKDLPEVLDTYDAEVKQIKAWVSLVADDAALEIPAIGPGLAKMRKLADRLNAHLAEMNTKRSPTKQLVHQFKSGAKERDLIDRIVNDMRSVKIDLIVRIQFALIGITNSIQSEMQVQVKDLQSMNRKLPDPPANSQYPKLIGLLEKNEPNPDGTVTVKKEDLDELLKQGGVELRPNPDLGEGRRVRKSIKNNVINETGFVVAGPQCPREVDPWRDDDVAIEYNNISGYALLHAQPNIDALSKMADARIKETEAKFGGHRRSAQPKDKNDEMDTS
ncbi:hypothetical protein CEP51_016242, partial [Fusarium floridanum]